MQTNDPPNVPKPLPSETPRTGFGAVDASTGAPDPMASFGYTVAAYAAIWLLLGAFLLSTWRRQLAIDKRLAQLEGAIDKAQGAPGKG